MTIIRQGQRSGEWLTAARMRGCSLVLPGLSVLVFAGWIAVSDGLIDSSGQPPIGPISSTSAPRAR